MSERKRDRSRDRRGFLPGTEEDMNRAGVHSSYSAHVGPPHASFIAGLTSAAWLVYDWRAGVYPDFGTDETSAKLLEEQTRLAEKLYEAHQRKLSAADAAAKMPPPPPRPPSRALDASAAVPAAAASPQTLPPPPLHTSRAHAAAAAAAAVSEAAPASIMLSGQKLPVSLKNKKKRRAATPDARAATTTTTSEDSRLLAPPPHPMRASDLQTSPPRLQVVVPAATRPAATDLAQQLDELVGNQRVDDDDGSDWLDA